MKKAAGNVKGDVKEAAEAAAVLAFAKDGAHHDLRPIGVFLRMATRAAARISKCTPLVAPVLAPLAGCPAEESLGDEGIGLGIAVESSDCPDVCGSAALMLPMINVVVVVGELESWLSDREAPRGRGRVMGKAVRY